MLKAPCAGICPTPLSLGFVRQAEASTSTPSKKRSAKEAANDFLETLDSPATATPGSGKKSKKQ